MKVTAPDGFDFDSLQQALTVEILQVIREELEKVEAPPDLVQQLTGSIAFAVTCTIDGVRGLEVGDATVSPILAFEKGSGELVSGGGESWMHEYVFRLLPAVFAQQPK